MLYLNNDVVVVNNIVENKLFAYDRIKRKKYAINEDSFVLLEYIFQKNGVTIQDLNSAFNCKLNSIIDEFIGLNIIVQEYQTKLHNIKYNSTGFCRAFIELTNKCNLFCKHCYDAFNENILDEHTVFVNAKK